MLQENVATYSCRGVNRRGALVATDRSFESLLSFGEFWPRISGRQGFQHGWIRDEVIWQGHGLLLQVFVLHWGLSQNQEVALCFPRLDLSRSDLKHTLIEALNNICSS